MLAGLVDRFGQDPEEFGQGGRNGGRFRVRHRNDAFGRDVRGSMLFAVLAALVAGLVFAVYLALRAVVPPHHDSDRGPLTFGGSGDDAAGPYHHGEWSLHHDHHGGDHHGP